MSELSIIDLTKLISLGHQVGYNGYYYKSNKDEYLCMQNELITSKIIKTEMINKYHVLVYTKNHIYKVPAGLSTYRICPEDLHFQKKILRESKIRKYK